MEKDNVIYRSFEKNCALNQGCDPDMPLGKLIQMSERKKPGATGDPVLDALTDLKSEIRSLRADVDDLTSRIETQPSPARMFRCALATALLSLDFHPSVGSFPPGTKRIFIDHDSLTNHVNKVLFHNNLFQAPTRMIVESISHLANVSLSGGDGRLAIVVSPEEISRMDAMRAELHSLSSQ